MTKEPTQLPFGAQLLKRAYEKPGVEELGSLTDVTLKTGPDPDQIVPALTEPFGGG